MRTNVFFFTRPSVSTLDRVGPFQLTDALTLRVWKPWPADRLKSLGAAEVLPDEGNLRAALEAKNFFAKPKLALDCVGGVSASRLVDTLQDGCPLVCFGCLGGRPVSLPWHALVARGLRCVLYKRCSPVARFQHLIASPFN
jgi:hypothetical protein